MSDNDGSPHDCSKSISSHEPRDTPIGIVPTPWDHPHSVQLRQAQRLEITSLGGIDPGTPPTAADVAVYLVAYDRGHPVGCGGLRRLVSTSGGLDDAAEIKRMFVERSHRGRLVGPGQPVAAMILAALEEAALRMGVRLLKLETGGFLKQARAFYERQGFTECTAFGAYTNSTNSVFYEKIIGI